MVSRSWRAFAFASRTFAGRDELVTARSGLGSNPRCRVQSSEGSVVAQPTQSDKQIDMPGPEPFGQPAPEITARAVGLALSWAAVGQVISRIAWFGSLLALAAFVAPAAFGTVTAALVVTSTATLLVGSGTRGAVITNEHLTAGHLRYALARNLSIGVVVTALVVALADPIVAELLPGADATVLRWLMISVGLHALAVVPLSVLQKNMQFKREASIVVGATMISAVAAIVAAVLGAGIWAIVLRQVLVSVVEVTLAWIAARRYLPGVRRLIGRGERPTGGRGRSARWFFLVSLFSLAAMSADYVVVGRLVGASDLGLYSIAFALGFAPLTQLSWWLGGVLLPAAAATPDLDLLAQRTLRAMRVMALVLVPLVVPALVLAPWLLPLTLGERWAGSVVVFQILFPVGVAHAVLNSVGESLGGSGNVKLHAQMLALWTVVILPALLVLVEVDGIRGAAMAHVLVLFPVAAGYLLLGARRLGLPTLKLVRGLAAVGPPFLAQLAVTLAGLGLLAGAGAPDALARVAGVAVGLGAGIGTLFLLPSGPLLEARTFMATARQRS